MYENIKNPIVYDRNLARKGTLQNASVSYVINMVPLSTATITLHSDELGVSNGDFIELFDRVGSLGYFLVTNVDRLYTAPADNTQWTQPTAPPEEITITLQHAMATLNDMISWGDGTFGGASQNLRAVLVAYLAHQPVSYWQAGTVDFDTHYTYTVSNASGMLDTVLALTEPLTVEWLWTFDFTTTPWTLGLRAPSTAITTEYRANRGLTECDVALDRTDLCTRMYGVGNNNLTMAAANGGVNYVEDTAAQALYGIKAAILVNTDLTTAADIKAAAQRELNNKKAPTTTTAITVVDDDDIGFYPRPGNMCRLTLPQHNVAYTGRITSVSKDDVYVKPGAVKVTVSNKTTSILKSVASTSKAVDKIIAGTYKNVAQKQASLTGLTWNTGTIAVPYASIYSEYLITADAVKFMAYRIGNQIRGSATNAYGDGSVRTVVFYASVVAGATPDADTLSMNACKRINHIASGAHSAFETGSAIQVTSIEYRG